MPIFRRWFELCLFVSLSSSTVHAQNAYVNFEGKQTNPIRLSPDGTRLFAVNTPDARLSVFDVSHPSNPFLIAEIPVGIEPVSVAARNNDEVWVVNEVSDSVSVVSVSQRSVTDTISIKDEPADVAFAGGRAFISASRNNRIAVFDVTNHSLLTNLAVFGENPRALAVNSNETKIYAAFALSGNHTTLIPFTNAPLQITNGTPPMDPNLPSPPQVALIVDATNSDWFPSVIKYNMPDNDVAEVDVATLTVSRYFSHVGTVNLGIAVRPGSGEIYVANTDARNLVHFEPALRGHLVDNRIARINSADGTVTNFDLNPGIDYTVLPNLAAKSNALAQPTAIAFDPSGDHCYIASFGTDRIARLDSDGNVLSRIEVGPPTEHGSGIDSRNMRGPRGLALNAAAQRLYVLNRIANTITIIDTATDSVLQEIPIGSFDPTPAVIRQGRGFLYDAKLSGNGTASCAACHVDSEMDMLAWDLGDPGGQMVTNITARGTFVYHPMKGPMVTQTLRGLNGLEPLHWRGDRSNFLHFNVAFDALMGGSMIDQTNMEAFRDFINTIRFEPNPNQLLDRSLPATFAGGNTASGKAVMQISPPPAIGLIGCNLCHDIPPGPGTVKDIIDTATFHSAQTQAQKIPHLRNLYQKTTFNNTPGADSIGGFGFRHDGMFSDLFAFFSQPFFRFANNATTKSNLVAFVLCFDTGTAPAVGYSRTLTASNIFDPGVSNDWSVLEKQTTTNIDLVAKGVIDGRWRGFVFQPGATNYLPDSTNLPPFTHADLIAKIQNGDFLTVMGVSPGEGTRRGIDRDGDGVRDGDVPPPQLSIESWNQQSAVLHWPFSAVGFGLEQTTDLLSNWLPTSDPVTIAGGQNYLTNSPSDAGKFYRLRFPFP
jgi:YVTN family beta-propeller protein